MSITKEKGFTLIELMIVVAIIGILAAVAIPRFADLIDRAKEAQTKGNLSSIRSAISIYYGVNEGRAPGQDALQGETEGTTFSLDAALVDEFISSLPGGEVPFVAESGDGDSEASYNWGEDDDVLYSNRNTPVDPQHTDGWSYDPFGPKLWVGIPGYDTGGSAIHTW